MINILEKLLQVEGICLVSNSSTQQNTLRFHPLNLKPSSYGTPRGNGCGKYAVVVFLSQKPYNMCTPFNGFISEFAHYEDRGILYNRGPAQFSCLLFNFCRLSCFLSFVLCTLFYIKSTFLFYTLRVSFCASSPIKAELKQAHLDICSKWSILAWRSRMFTTVAWGRRNTPKDIWRISVPKLKWQDAANVEK